MKISEKEHERRMVFAREKAAKAWCEKETSRIVMDDKLAEAFANILVIKMYEPHLGCASTRELLEELTARIDDLDYKTVPDNEQNANINPQIKLNKSKEKESKVKCWESFWNEYPKKQGKKDAEDYFLGKSFNITANKFNEIMVGLENAIKSEQWKKDGGQYIPLPATFLRKERWKDIYIEHKDSQDDEPIPSYHK